MVPFTIGRVGAAGGVMITASHNPAKDNGCKSFFPLPDSLRYDDRHLG